jgi:hypothetical protein
MSNLEVFDAANLVKLHCGTAEDGKITFFLPEGEIVWSRGVQRSDEGSFEVISHPSFWSKF